MNHDGIIVEYLPDVADEYADRIREEMTRYIDGLQRYVVLQGLTTIDTRKKSERT